MSSREERESLFVYVSASYVGVRYVGGTRKKKKKTKKETLLLVAYAFLGLCLFLCLQLLLDTR